MAVTKLRAWLLFFRLIQANFIRMYMHIRFVRFVFFFPRDRSQDCDPLAVRGARYTMYKR